MINIQILAIAIVVTATIPCVYRVIVGPSLPDRLAASDALGNAMVVLFGLYAFEEGSEFLMDVALLLAIISFIGTVAVAKYIYKGEVL